MAVITDPPPTSSVAVKPDIITLYYREPDVMKTEAKPTPSSLWPRRHFRLLYGVPLRRDPMHRGDVQPNQGDPSGGSRGEDQAGVGHGQAVGKFPIPFEEPDSFI